MRTFTFLFFQLLFANMLFAQPCADPLNIFSFQYDGKTYEIVRQNKVWTDAAACAVERGGVLAEINTQEEQDSLNYWLTMAGITTSNTIAPDGGGAAYVWIGGNDLSAEGMWIWDGDNDGSGTQFWQGNYTGGPVAGAYTNWGSSSLGSEPDDFGSGQDALGLALTNWPLGNAGQWNDVAHTNSLYFVIEKDATTSIDDAGMREKFRMNYNPYDERLVIYTLNGEDRISHVRIHNLTGQLVLHLEPGSPKVEINLTALDDGLHLLSIFDFEGMVFTRKIVK